MLYGITYGYNGKDAPGAELTFGMLGAYAQDEYSITPNLKLTYGLRFDLPLYFDDLLGMRLSKNSHLMERMLTYPNYRKVNC